MNIEIEEHQVHVWQANMNALSVHSKDILKVLSADELERANKFKFPEDLGHFILRRYQLRFILSKYWGCQPHELMFRYNSCKKPFIYIPEFKGLKFNMSFSGDLMVVGLSKNNEVGIDIEKVSQMQDLENIAIENFSLQEVNFLNGTKDKTSTFFKIWTRKEAFIKAIGNGMYYPLKSFSVNIDPAGRSEHLVIFNHPMESGLWRTSEINTSDGYIASVAIKSDKFHISYFQL
jgi:4'-phosphopantetheinyl transferase